jgi:hypothetical protein
MAYLIGCNLREVFIDDARKKAKNNKVYSILIATLMSSQFVLVNKTFTFDHMWLALKSFDQKKGGEVVLLLAQNFQHTKMVDGEDFYQHLTTMLNLLDEMEEITRATSWMKI